MLSYLNKNLSEEYHHLSLWYFVTFLYGIIFYFSIKFDHRLIIAPLFLVLFYLIWSRRNQQNIDNYDNLVLRFFIFNLLFFTIGLGSGFVRSNHVNTKSIDKAINTEITGLVDQIKPTNHGYSIILNDTKISDPKFQIHKVKIAIGASKMENLQVGDILKLKAKLYPLQQTILPGTYDFGFYMYYAGIEASGYALSAPEILGSRDNIYHNFIQNLRQKIYVRLIEVMGKEQGNFVAAILIGETKAIERKLADTMRNSGIAHILAVSGLHLSLVAMIFFISFRVLLNCSNYLAYHANIKLISGVASILGSFFYLLISGSNIAATRAFIMTFIFILAILLGRSVYPLRSVMIAAFVILLISPEYVFHPSFQLSFSAVLCLIAGYEFYIRNSHIFGNSKSILSKIKLYLFANIYSSFLASIVTAPFVIFHFYKFATYSIPMNLVAVPIMSFFIMPLSLISLILMPIHLDSLFLKLLGFFVQIIIDSASYVVSLPGSVWYTGYITAQSMIIFSFGFFWICLWQTKLRLFGFLIMLISLIMMYLTPKPDLIYDDRFKALGVRNEQGLLEIHTDSNMPKFTRDFWASWYGQKEVRVINKKVIFKDLEFKTKTSKKIALNYWNCHQDADISLITSKKLDCSALEKTVPVISYQEIKNKGVVLIYCDNKGCHEG